MSNDLLGVDDFFSIDGGLTSAGAQSKGGDDLLNTDDFFMVNESGVESEEILSLQDSFSPMSMDNSIDTGDFFSLPNVKSAAADEDLQKQEHTSLSNGLVGSKQESTHSEISNGTLEKTVHSIPTVEILTSSVHTTSADLGIQLAEPSTIHAQTALFAELTKDEHTASLATKEEELFGSKMPAQTDSSTRNSEVPQQLSSSGQPAAPKQHDANFLFSTDTQKVASGQVIAAAARQSTVPKNEIALNFSPSNPINSAFPSVNSSMSPTDGIDVLQEPPTMLVVDDEAVAANAMDAVDQFLADLERQKSGTDRKTPAPSLNLDEVIKQSTTVVQTPSPIGEEGPPKILSRGKGDPGAKGGKVSKKRVSWADTIGPNTAKKAALQESAITGDVETGPTVKLPQISEKWDSVFSEIDDGREHFVPTNNLEKAQLKVRLFIDNLAVRVFGCFLILLDIILTIIDLSIKDKPQSTQLFYDAMALTISIIFMIDLMARIFAYGPKKFFSDKWEVADACIIVITFVTVVVYIALDEKIAESDTNAADIGRLIVLTRVLRIARLGRVFYGHQQVQASARRTVSQNKRRYQKDGFDLDLTYVTDRIIAMSFPSSGRTSAFRNPIEEVSRFMKTKHPGKYKLYNLCSERSYDPKHFEGRVGRVLIDDHNVPRIQDLVDFIGNARKWMDEDEENIMAIHCKGGKGRTGTIVCSWLLEEGKFDSAKEALHYFGERRTDLEAGDTFQGVETASQIRYVGYFEKIKKEYNGKLPEPVTLDLKTVKIYSIKGVGRGNGSDLSMSLIIDGNEVFHCKLAESLNCSMQHNSEQNFILYQVNSCPLLNGDVKVRFTSTCKELPRGYDNCPFYFWFNTSFVPQDKKLRLEREEIDNPHKKKTWNVFKEDFAIELEFEDADTDC